MNLTCWQKSMKLWRRSMCKKYVQIKDVDAIHWIVPRNGYFYMRDTLRLPSRRLVWGKVCYCLSFLSFLLLHIILTSESSILIMVASVPIYPPATSLVEKYINGIKFFNYRTDHLEFPEERWATKGILIVPSWTTISTCKGCDARLSYQGIVQSAQSTGYKWWYSRWREKEWWQLFHLHFCLGSNEGRHHDHLKDLIECFLFWKMLDCSIFLVGIIASEPRPSFFRELLKRRP